MNTTQIYNALLAGKTLQMEFESRDSAETFRTRLHRIKASQEVHLLGLGMMNDEDISTFSFTRVTGNDVRQNTWELKFIKQRLRKEYKVVIVDNDDYRPDTSI